MSTLRAIAVIAGLQVIHTVWMKPYGVKWDGQRQMFLFGPADSLPRV